MSDKYRAIYMHSFVITLFILYYIILYFALFILHSSHFYAFAGRVVLVLVGSNFIIYILYIKKKK